MTEDLSKADKALGLLKQQGLDGLIVYSNGTCSMLCPSYFHYFAELRPMGLNNALVISRSGDAIMLVEPA